MTTDLEKQFFDTFGIEQRERKACVDENTLCPTPEKECGDCSYFQYVSEDPQITDRILLELICIVNKHLDEGFWAENMTDLKEEALQNCLLAVNTTDYGVAGYEEEVKQQVQALFKE